VGSTTLSFALSASQALPGGRSKNLSVDRTGITIQATPERGPASELKAVVPEGVKAKQSVMLLLDVSGSMLNEKEKLPAEKDAALAFLDKIEDTDIRVGVVTFGDPAIVAVEPAVGPENRNAIRATIEKLNPDPRANTAMFEAVKIAAAAMPQDGTRSIVMITDGKDEDLSGRSTLLPEALKALGSSDLGNKVRFSGVLVGNENAKNIRDIAGSDGTVSQAQNRSEYSRQLNSLVQDNVQQQELTLPVSTTIQQSWFGQTVKLEVRATSSGKPIEIDPIFRPIPKAIIQATTASALPPLPEASSRAIPIPDPVFILALVAVFGGLAVLLSTAMGGLAGASDKESAVIRRLEVYTVNPGGAPTRVAVTEQTTRLGDSALTRSAVSLMTKVARSSQLDRALDSRLEAAGLPLRTAEWMLLHVSVSVGAALLLLLLSGGSLAATILGLLIGLGAPWMFLSISKSRRESKFLAQLPDTLQLLAGSLAAGYSLPQAMDAVVRETGPPISLEFNRALIEARLGMLPEDALDGIAKRTGSTDFSWIVMAIRIQRDVGGNLAELLSSVAGTLRERERLRRQVSALSAEGRLSGMILGALPLVFALYLLVTRPDYIAPLFSQPLGLLMLAVGSTALVIGGIWMSRVVKVKV
jgi:tight adherence protein B